MKAPLFWNRPDSVLGSLLSPLGFAYGYASRMRRAAATETRIDAKVVCIGNLVAGGAGKTPTALATAELLGRDDLAFLSRGSGGRLSGPVRVDPAAHTAADVGDEPLLLARAAPTWIARDRVAGARAAAEAGAQTIIMDDGFQNSSLGKDVAIIVVDGATGFGNGRTMPAGPLRESVAHGLTRAQAAVIIGDDQHRVAADLPPSLPVFSAHVVPTAEAKRFSGKRLVAFAGIGRPQKFFDTLAGLDCELIASHAFPDHHRYGPEEIMAICEEATTLEATPITTEKDAVRLPDGAREMVDSLPVTLEWQEPDPVARFLTAQLA